MTDRDKRLESIQRAVDELIPRLSERLTRYGLGEIEVRQGELRVRVQAPPVAPEPPLAGRPVLPLAGSTTAPPARGDHAPPPAPAQHGVTSPAVGFFIYAEGLGPGLVADKGDLLGHVEMLGVRHDVRAPRRGTVRHLVTEAGDPVEYGQLLVELEPAE
jgi:biotin carboxyl carrier protein